LHVCASQVHARSLRTRQYTDNSTHHCLATPAPAAASLQRRTGADAGGCPSGGPPPATCAPLAGAWTARRPARLPARDQGGQAEPPSHREQPALRALCTAGETKARVLRQYCTFRRVLRILYCDRPNSSVPFLQEQSLQMGNQFAGS